MITVVGEIAVSDLRTYRDKRTGRPAYRLETVLQTDGPRLKMTFFAKSQGTASWQAKRLSKGRRGVFGGQVSTFRGEWQLTNPHMVLFGVASSEEDEDGGIVDSFGDLYPIYPQTKGVESWDIQRAINFARSIIDDVPEVVPDDVRDKYDVVDARTAVDLIHAPDTFAQVEVGRRRYRFEEALVTQVVLGRRRAFLHALGAQARTGGGGLLAAFDERLPFALTDGQRAIGEVIETALAQPHPMNRLLQGEVGSGKTVVALRAMLRVVDSGGQAALLAPTEVLAQQHYRSITAMLGDLAAGGMLGGDCRRHDRGAAHRVDAQGGAGRVDVADGDRRGRHRHRHPRAARGEGAVRRPRPGGRRRAAPLRRRAARRPHRQGRLAAARAGDDRDPDPAHRRDDRVRRPRGLDALGAARRPRADPDQRRAARRAARLGRAGVAAGARGGREGPPGVRRVPADHRRRAGGGRPRPRRRRGRGAAAPGRPSAPSPRSSSSSAPARWRGCASRCCTAG